MARNRKHKQKKNFAEKRREKQKVQTLIVEKNNTGYNLRLCLLLYTAFINSIHIKNKFNY